MLNIKILVQNKQVNKYMRAYTRRVFSYVIFTNHSSSSGPFAVYDLESERLWREMKCLFRAACLRTIK